MATLFLLSPARCGGPRAEQLMASRTAALGAELRGDGAAIGDVFTWLSALYFRGKLAYAQTFAPEHTYVMAAGAGLVLPATRIVARQLRAMGRVDVESAAFVRPLRRDAEVLREQHADARIVLLGSIATGKYIDTLLAVFGTQLLFPAEFVGRGDMSRGGLLLRAARDRSELAYTPVLGATLHGSRPPKLPAIARRPDAS
jgi:hypothetical protein